ncbi:hypothetical protein ACWEPC_32475 [Nonomuraea sp. NPDC004297]
MGMARNGSGPSARLWVTVAATGVPAVGLVGFFTDPLGLPPGLLEVLDQPASVVSMFVGASGPVVAVMALLLQIRAGRGQSAAAVIAGHP